MRMSWDRHAASLVRIASFSPFLRRVKPNQIAWTEWLVFEQQLEHAYPASALPINHFDQPEARGI
jgi:hypothetical protein